MATRISPYSAEMPLKNVTVSEIKAWRASINPKTEATNAATYRLLRSLLQAAEEEELIDRVGVYKSATAGVALAVEQERRRASEVPRVAVNDNHSRALIASESQWDSPTKRIRSVGDVV